MPLHENSRGVCECTRVPMGLLPMGLLPPANFFQKSMSYYVFREHLYQICEVYIDDLLTYSTDDDDFVRNVGTIFQKCREKNVILSAKNCTWASIPSLLSVTSSTPLASTWRKMYWRHHTFSQPNTSTELYSFLKLANFFKDHIPQHSMVAQPLHTMVCAATKSKQKQISWTEEGKCAFSTLKSLVNKFPKLYFIDTTCRLYCILTRQITPTEHTYASYNKMTTAPLMNFPSGFWAELSVAPRSDGRPLRRLPFVGR